MAGKAVGLKREVNFFAALRQYEAVREKRGKSSRLWVTVIAALAVVSVAGYGVWMTYRISRLDDSIAAMSLYVNNTENQAAFARQDQLRGEMQVLRAYNEACRKYIEHLRDVPRVESGNFSDVWSELPADVKVVAYQYEAPLLTIRCETADKNAPALFAEKLTKTGKFVDVTYEGFALEGNKTDGLYGFAILCRLW